MVRSALSVALGGFGPEAQVVAEHLADEFAALCLVTDPPVGQWVVLLQLVDGEWLIRTEGDGTVWIDHGDDDDELGVLAHVQPPRKPGRYHVRAGAVEVVVEPDPAPGRRPRGCTDATTRAGARRGGPDSDDS